jgi:signal transduction histidine kinase/ligand-binding sensor domain-containing protein
MEKIIFIAGLFFVGISCNQNKIQEKPDRSNMVRVSKADFVDISADTSIVTTKIIKVEAPEKIPALEPLVQAINSNEYEVKGELIDKEIDLKNLEKITPGKGGLKPAIIKTIEPTIIRIKPPEIIVAKDMDFKEKNADGFSYFNSLHGLPSSVIRDILEDKRGNLWIATTGGLACYDGKNFSLYTEENGMRRNDITLIEQGNDGRLMIGDYSGNFQFFDGKNIVSYALHEGMVMSVHEDKKGNIWIGCSEDFIYKFDGEKFTSYGLDQGFEGNRVFNIIEKNDGTIWFGTSKGIYIYDGTSFSKLPFEKSCGEIAMDASGNVFFLSENNLIKFDGRHIVKFKLNASNGKLCYYNMIFDSSGNLWIGTFNGIFIFNGKSIKTFGENSGLPDLDVNSIHEDKTGTFWIGLGGGVCRFNGNLVTNFSQKIGLPGNDTKSLFVDSKGRIWSELNGNGFSYFDGKKLYNITKTQGWRGGSIFSMAEDAKGVMWFGLWGGGICSYDGKKFVFYTEKEGLAGNGTYSILIDIRDNIWINTNKGTSVLSADRSEFKTYKYKNSDCNNSRSIIRGKADDILVGSCNGIYKYNKNNIYQGRRVGDILGGAESLLYDKNGYIWTGSYENGLFCYDGQKSIHFPANVIGLKNTIVSMVQDNMGDIWLGTFNSGFMKLDYKKFEIFKTKIDSLRNSNEKEQYLENPNIIIKYGLEDGFFAKTVNHRTANKDRNGNLFFGTSEGVLKISYSNKTTDTIKPKINLQVVEIFNESVLWEDVKKAGNKILKNGIPLGKITFESISSFNFQPVNLSLPFENNNITFVFQGISIKSGNKMLYKYMLEGLDKNWGSLTAKSTVNYGNLDKGKYIFKVKTMNPFGIWSDELEYPFEIRPPWYGSKIAYLSYLLVSALLGWWILSNQKQRTIRKEREKIQKKELEQAKEIERAYAELKVTQNQLVHQQKLASLGALTAGIAHEIKNPLNFVNNFADISKELLDEMGEEIDKGNLHHVKELKEEISINLTKINEHGKRADSIVKNMLEHSRSGSSEKENINLNKLCDEYLNLAYHGMKAKDKTFNCTMEKHFAKNLPNVHLVQQEIGRVILNLINNAFYAIQNKPDGRLVLTTLKKDDKVIISIKDNGTGIPEHIKNKIFEPFFTTKPTGSGTGLGLSMSFDIIRAHKGLIEVESEPGQGSEFKITLPIN